MEGDSGKEKNERQAGFSRREKNPSSGGRSQVTLSYGKNKSRNKVEKEKENKKKNQVEIMYTTNRRLIKKREPEISWKERRVTTKPGRRHYTAVKKGCGRELTTEEREMTQTQREKREKGAECQRNLSTKRTEKNPYWRPQTVTSKASKPVRRKGKPGQVSQRRKRTRRFGDETEEEHGKRPQKDASSYENMCNLVV